MPVQDVIVTVDAALFTIVDQELALVLCKREKEPYQGRLALPGGYVHTDEDPSAEGTARRVLTAKTGVSIRWLEQLYTFSGTVRDPRGWSVSIAFYALVPHETLLTELNEHCSIVKVHDIPDLPFDHNRIVEMALSRLRGKSTYSSLPVYLLPEEFSISQLHEVYSVVLGTKLNKAAFRKKIEDQHIIEAVPGKRLGTGRRPAQLYRLATATLKDFGRQQISG